MSETSSITQLDTTNKHEAIVYLWKSKIFFLRLNLCISPYNHLVHNRVNKRLHGDITEDPKHPKVQFPSKYLCTTCRSIINNKYDIPNMIDFLIKYYSKENMDTSLVLNKTHNPKDLLNRKDYIISKMDYNNETIERFDLLRFFPTIVQRFPSYTFIVFIIIIALFRHRHCKAKRKRYTL